MKFIIFILLIFAVIFFLVPSIIAGIIRFFITMLGGGSTSYKNTTDRSNNDNYTRFNRNETTSDSTKKKVFDKNEGEYVSFEEIKKEPDEENK